MASLRSELLDHLLDNFEEKDKIILRKMIKASLDDGDDAALAHRIFKSVRFTSAYWPPNDTPSCLDELTSSRVVAYIGAHSPFSRLETTALESIQETLASLAGTTNTASATNATQPTSRESYIANEAQEEATAYTHTSREKHSQGSVETPSCTAQNLAIDLAKTQLHDQRQTVSVGSETPKSLPVNYGMKMMMKNGWKPGQGLGARGDGITEPILSTEQLVPDRKDSNPGVGSQKRLGQVTGRASTAANQVSTVSSLPPKATH